MAVDLEAAGSRVQEPHMMSLGWAHKSGVGPAKYTREVCPKIVEWHSSEGAAVAVS